MSPKRPSRTHKSKRRGTISSPHENQIRYPIPLASARAWEAIKERRGVSLNPGLIFDRFAPDWSSQATIKNDGLEVVSRAASKADKTLLQAWNDRWEEAARSAKAKPFSLKTDWRLVAGLGRKSALEVGFTFHRYGLPILPGSSLKGLARTWALIEIAEKAKPSSLKGLEDLDEFLSADGEKGSEERKKYENWQAKQPEEVRKLSDDFRTIFGTKASAGQAIFFDAIPARVPSLELDVMNPHYPRYYSDEEEYPTDWQSPVPIYFLTVKAGSKFRFAIAWRGKPGQEGSRLQEKARQWLIKGLTELGAGAKTGAGYGYFADFQESEEQPGTVTSEQALSKETASQPVDPHQRLVDDFKDRLQGLPLKNVAGQVAQFVEQWRQSELPDEYRLQMAQAILDKVEAARRTKKSQKKRWFQELQAFVTEHGASED